MATDIGEHQIERMPVNDAFAKPASDEAFERAAAALRAHKVEVVVVADAAAAREAVLALIPEGAEVGGGASATMEAIGVTEVIERSGRYDAVRPRTRAMDRAAQMREIHKLGAAPDFFVNSVAALAEDGTMVVASATGSQLGPIAFGAGRLILVVGPQKVVADLDMGLRRVREYCLPLEDADMQRLYGARSAINKLLVFNAEAREGRTTVVMVREPVGR